MDHIIECLIHADKQLETISVKGADVYALVNARNALKSAYDTLIKEAAEDVSESK